MSDNPRSWDWRKATGGWWMDTDVRDGRIHRLFHAYDVNNLSACEPSAGLVVSCEEPNEGSELCPACIEVVKAEPFGREKRVPAGGAL